MNKATKGAIAAGAAGILLLGGAGTFALWEDNATVDAAPISTGVLTLGVAGGTWTDVSDPQAPVAIANIADFAIVPGDTLTYTTTATITAEGDNLEGELKLNKTAFEAAAEAAAPYFNVTASNNAAIVPGLTVDGPTQAITFTTAGTYNVAVTITVVFEDVNAEVGQNADIDLSALALTLDQV